MATTLAHQALTLGEQIEAYDTEIRRILRLHPDGELYRSLPGAGDLLGARMVGELGDNRERYPEAAVAQCEAGTAPVTKPRGGRHRPINEEAPNFLADLREEEEESETKSW